MKFAAKLQARRTNTARNVRRMVMPRAQRLLIQHSDGWLENMGEVEVSIVTDLSGARRVQWRAADGRTAAAAIAHMDDLRRPLEVRMREGGRQIWFLGEHAAARGSAAGYYNRVAPPVLV